MKDVQKSVELFEISTLINRCFYTKGNFQIIAAAYCMIMWSSSNLKSESCACCTEISSFFYASERSNFSPTGIVASDDGLARLSTSDGLDSCFAAAWRTRFWTANEDGDVGSPMPLVSNFSAAHENA